MAMRTGGPKDPKPGDPKPVGENRIETAREVEVETDLYDKKIAEDRKTRPEARRAKKKAASGRRGTHERAHWELQAGLTELSESPLALADERLATIGNLIALLDLIAALGNGSTAPRRLIVRDRSAAFDYLISTNPTTIFLDAPFVALGRFDPIQVEGDLGRTLAGQRALEMALL